MGLLVDIRKRLGPFRLDVRFDTGEGVTGVLGASGCGKSLTLRCIAGVEAPDEGYIALDGRVLFDARRRVSLPPQRRRVGLLFQHYALFPNMTVEQNIAAGVRDPAARRETAASLLAAFRLEDCRKRYPRQISGGQRQRAALARILASRPAALLLDEPFSALDGYLREQVALELADRLARFRGPVLLVTHSREEIARLCSRACVLEQGKSQPLLPVGELFQAPATLSACRLAGWKNISRIRPLPGGRAEALDWGVTLALAAPPGPDVSHIAIQAHALRPAEGPGENRLHCSAGPVFPAPFSTAVVLTPPAGPPAALYMELPRGQWEALGAPAALWVELPAPDLRPLAGG